MARYTLKTLYGTEQMERFDHRSSDKLKGILSHDRYDHAGETGPFGEIVKHPDGFEVFNSLMEKVFRGNIQETRVFIRTLK